MQVLSNNWLLATDPENVGKQEAWYAAGPTPAARPAPVPGLIQDLFPNYHGVAWYWHTFTLNDDDRPIEPGAERLLVHFGAVDYLGEVWLNGQYIGCGEGGETPFEFDLGDALRPLGDNLLVVRVLNPADTPIDGYVLKEVPHSNRTNSTRAGSSTNMGGITYPVTLRRVPAVYISDLFVRPDVPTGQVAVTVTVYNALAGATPTVLTLRAAPAQAGDDVAASEQAVTLPVGVSEHELNVTVPEPHLWDLDDAYLYRVTVTISTPGSASHQQTVRCGFRELRVTGGYFFLNGKRIFLKSAHTGRGTRRDMLLTKAAGFNMVRFIAGVADPQQLEFCDELGLMVYEESLASWLLGDSTQMGERYDRSTGAMIRRDRNHASITIWGLLNETENGPVFRQAVAYLPKLRQLDPTRLVLLSSGRWDGDPSVGSVSNPGGLEWEPQWGVEGTNPPQVNPKHCWGYMDRAGDAHHYPYVPLPTMGLQFFHDLGHTDKPVFLSEFGIGPVQDVIRDWRYFQQLGVNEERDDVSFLRGQALAFMADWQRLGFDEVYPFPEDFLRESQRLAARHRTLSFDLIRGNPRLCGHNLTALNDGMTGEGLWNIAKEVKPATFDALADGWAPLRWCVLADPMHGYAGSDVAFRVALANEGVLRPADYDVRLRILGPAGTAWEKSLCLTIPDPSPLAQPVLQEKLRLSGPPGEYTFAANLEQGGAVAGGRLAFYLSDRAALPRLSGSAMTWGLNEHAVAWLGEHGLTCRPLAAGRPGAGDLILVFKPFEHEITGGALGALFEGVAAGAIAIFLNHKALNDGKTPTGFLPFSAKGSAYAFADWLYHKECVARRHPVFGGLQAPGILDWDYWGPVIPREIYEGLTTPDETMAASFVTAHHKCPGGYGCGLLLAAYNHGAGRIILNTFHLLENLDQHPAADRLLLNLIAHAQCQAPAESGQA
jgi:Glycosyl hydrolases family 2/Glycosyl hydrolases family 2, sugar binding domain/Glycosyl hydrolases family 2, TIM barrel domain